MQTLLVNKFAENTCTILSISCQFLTKICRLLSIHRSKKFEFSWEFNCWNLVFWAKNKSHHSMLFSHIKTKTMLSFNITKGRKGGKVYFGFSNYCFHFCVIVSQLLNQPQQLKEHCNPGLYHTVIGLWLQSSWPNRNAWFRHCAVQVNSGVVTHCISASNWWWSPNNSNLQTHFGIQMLPSRNINHMTKQQHILYITWSVL